MAFRSRRLRVQLPCQVERSLVDVVAARDATECPAEFVSVSDAPCNWVFASSPPCREQTCIDLTPCEPPAVSEAPATDCPAGFATPGPDCPSGVSECPGGGISEDVPSPTDCFPTLCPDLFHTVPCRDPSCDFFSKDVVIRQNVRGDVGTVLVDPRALPVLRERLAQRLRQIEEVDREKEHLQARIGEIDAAAEELRRRGDAVG